MNNEIWWDVFRRASELRARLQHIEETIEREEKRAAIQAIKREVWEILNDQHMQQPLRMLIVDLWGGPKTVINRHSWSAEKLAAAKIEAEQPNPIGDKRVRTLLKGKGWEATLDQVKNWRRDPEYQRFVNVRSEIPKSENEIKNIREKSRRDVKEAKKALK